MRLGETFYIHLFKRNVSKHPISQQVNNGMYAKDKPETVTSLFRYQ